MLVKATDKDEVIKHLRRAVSELYKASNYIYAHDKSGLKKIKNIKELIYKLESQLK